MLSLLPLLRLSLTGWFYSFTFHFFFILKEVIHKLFSIFLSLKYAYHYLFHQIYIIYLHFSLFWGVLLCLLYAGSLVWGIQLICIIRNGISTYINDKYQKAADSSCRMCIIGPCKRHHRFPYTNCIPKVPEGFDSALESVSIFFLYK